MSTESKWCNRCNSYHPDATPHVDEIGKIAPNTVNLVMKILVKEILVEGIERRSLKVYEVESELNAGSWTESFATMELLLAYLRGVNNVTFSTGIKVEFEPGSIFDRLP